MVNANPTCSQSAKWTVSISSKQLSWAIAVGNVQWGREISLQVVFSKWTQWILWLTYIFVHQSGGYVWISKCCDKNFISIFRESIFENSAHPPTVLLKLIYHWACQTTVNNVILWVKVDRLFLRTFYAMLRSVCTVQVHTTTPVFCANKNGRVEIGVISLGTTSSDGKRRDVKVEVLGVYDQETKKFRLRASEPIDGDSRSRARFARILEPLARCGLYFSIYI